MESLPKRPLERSLVLSPPIAWPCSSVFREAIRQHDRQPMLSGRPSLGVAGKASIAGRNGYDEAGSTPPLSTDPGPGPIVHRRLGRWPTVDRR